MKLGERLERRRIELNLSREFVAMKAKVGEKSVYNYERGLRSPTVRDLQKIASVLQTTMSWLLEEPFDLEGLPDEEEIASHVVFLRHRPDIRDDGVLRIMSKALEKLSKEDTLFQPRRQKKSD